MEEQILKRAWNDIQKYGAAVPSVAVVLGSGLGAWADTLTEVVEIPYSKITGLLPSTVEGHDGKFVIGMKNGVRVIACKGRVHYYEGYSSAEVVRPVRLCAMSGAKTLILTNAAGAVNPSYRAGDFMVIRDHICTIPSPLIGENQSMLGTRFPDMGEVYSRDIIERFSHVSSPSIHCGVYIQVSGPQYETPSEIRMYRGFGADAVGMSTAVEAIAAKHAGMNVFGLSCITNTASGSTPTPLSHTDVQHVANLKRTDFNTLLDTAVAVATTSSS